MVSSPEREIRAREPYPAELSIWIIGSEPPLLLGDDLLPAPGDPLEQNSAAVVSPPRLGIEDGKALPACPGVRVSG